MVEEGPDSAEIFTVQVKLSPGIVRCITHLGGCNTIGKSFNNILENSLQKKLENVNAKILKIHDEAVIQKAIDNQNYASPYKNGEWQDLLNPKQKKWIYEQKNLIQMSQALRIYSPSPETITDTGETPTKETDTYIKLAVVQVFLVYALTKSHNESITIDLIDLLLDLANSRLDSLNTQLLIIDTKILQPNEVKDSIHTDLDTPTPETEDILVEKNKLMHLISELSLESAAIKDKIDRQYRIEAGIPSLVETLSNVLNVPNQSISEPMGKMLQSLKNQESIITYGEFFDKFQANLANFQEIAQIFQVNPKKIPSKTQELARAASKKKVKKEVPSRKPKMDLDLLPRTLHGISKSAKTEISKPATTDEAVILRVLTENPQSIRDVITALGITDMLDARSLQMKLQAMEKSGQIEAKPVRGRKYYSKKK